MTPWEILGWMIVSIVGIILAIVLWGILYSLCSYFAGKLQDRIKHWKTRNIAPAKGQRWKQESSTLTISDVFDNGNIGIRTGNASWGENPETWKNRVRNRKLYLINP